MPIFTEMLKDTFSARASHKPDWNVLPSVVAMENVVNYRIFEMEKEFIFFAIVMVQGDKSIFTEIENKWTFWQATIITSGRSLEEM